MDRTSRATYTHDIRREIEREVVHESKYPTYEDHLSNLTEIYVADQDALWKDWQADYFHMLGRAEEWR